MSSADLIASTVMDDTAAVCMNDAAKTVYTYTVQIPFLRMAMNELQEFYQLHGIATVQKQSAVIQVDAGATEIIFGGTPALPTDLIEPENIWERIRDTDPYIPVFRRTYIPLSLTVPVSAFGIYVWQEQKLILPESNRDNDIKIEYLKEMFAQLVDQNSQINVINARVFLQFKSGALMAENIERDTNHAAILNAQAEIALERTTGIAIKGKQNIMSRRRPFRAGYKIRTSGV